MRCANRLYSPRSTYKPDRHHDRDIWDGAYRLSPECTPPVDSCNEIRWRLILASVGTDSYNQDLSQRRANAVKSSLITRGVDPSRIGSQGYGKGFPVAGNTESGGRQLNRRVEVVT
jgi:OmpA family